MSNAISIIVSVWFWVSLFLLSALIFPFGILIFLLTVAFDRKRTILHYYTCTWAYIVVSVNPFWKIRIEGRKKIVAHIPYIMVANHASGADILVLYRLFRPFKWVAKRSLFFMPFMGWNMWLNGYIPIVRSKGKSKLQMMDKAVVAVKSGNSVMIFPEGTRSPDGKIQTFKTGSFRLAVETQTAILPIAVKGTFSAIRKGGLMIHKNHQIKAIVMEPIPFDTFRNMEIKDIATMVHNLIRDRLASDV